MTVDERPVVLTGANGAGKTNLLEALSFLAPGRGLRRAALGEVARRGAPAGTWSVAAALDGAEGPVEVGTGIASAGDDPPRRRAVRIDGADAASQADLAHYVTMNWLTPEMDRLFDSGTSERRRLSRPAGRRLRPRPRDACRPLRTGDARAQPASQGFRPARRRRMARRPGDRDGGERRGGGRGAPQPGRTARDVLPRGDGRLPRRRRHGGGRGGGNAGRDAGARRRGGGA